jgi:hypothetical protein
MMKGNRTADIFHTIARKHGYTVERVLPSRGRHEYAILRQGDVRAFLKAGPARATDHDEPRMLHNFQREVWWAKTVQRLRGQRDLPFTSPSVLRTNVTRRGCAGDMAWILFAFEDASALAQSSIWDMQGAHKDWDASGILHFRKALPRICATLHALESIGRETVASLGVPPDPPRHPHGDAGVWPELWPFLVTHRILSQRVVEESRAALGEAPASEERVLGQGDFDVSHLHIRADGTVVLVDNEFAGWYPRLDSLAYCVHRLWANRRRPDLAQELLAKYTDTYVPRRVCQTFMTEIFRLLLPRVLRGFYYDAVRRDLSPSHETQVCRRELLSALLHRDHAALFTTA